MVGPPRGVAITMNQPALSRPQVPAERIFSTVERFMHIEAVSGIVLLIAAASAMIWANSPFAATYHALWHLPVSFRIGGLVFSQSLHFIVNDVLMTLFFLIVGMEIRYEIHNGALSNLRKASLPVVTALGGVIVPALIYLSLNAATPGADGWAVPTATDIAFAVGVLALLGKGIPSGVRIFLLALAIIDDIVAVLIITIFYNSGFDSHGLVIAGLGMVGTFIFQRIGISSAIAYLLPGVVIWSGLLITGVHPALAGVLSGMMTPLASLPLQEEPEKTVARAAQKLRDYYGVGHFHHLPASLRTLRLAQRELLPPVMRVQTILHPWVAFGIMPLFALANAGVTLNGINLSDSATQWVISGVMLSLVFGKPLGVLCVSWIAVRSGLCQLPDGVSWGGIVLIGLLAGIGFTMAMFTAMLSFDSDALLNSARLGVLTGSLIAAILGLLWGVVYRRTGKGSRPIHV
ncbi:Na+/H+ antiporter NhaA [Enterobacteriaceae bacterium ESL0689]|nr:Na+/H+ antiporter NhaA [Enterobacteriaceae bacterium ESL0689]